jgi:hypothetical protein
LREKTLAYLAKEYKTKHKLEEKDMKTEIENNYIAKTPMGKAFATVRGAIQRGDIPELKCKLIWLNAVLRALPDTIFANEAENGILAVNEKLKQLALYENAL